MAACPLFSFDKEKKVKGERRAAVWFAHALVASPAVAVLPSVSHLAVEMFSTIQILPAQNNHASTFKQAETSRQIRFFLFSQN